MTEKQTIDTDVETVVIADDQRKVTFSYTRKKNLGNYESEDIGIYMTDVIPKSTKNIVKWVSDKSEAAFNECKTQVWSALGLPFSFDDVGNPQLDTPPPVTAVAQAQLGLVAPPITKNVIAPINPPQMPAVHQRADGPTVAQIGVYPPEPTFCKDCGAQGLASFYDNRQEVDTKIRDRQKIGPDFKCRHCSGGNGKGKPIYRPGSYDYNQAIGNAPVSTTPPGGAWDEDPF